jgi:molybdopterin-guanine dinucleotide biosynthesis protein A
LSLPHSGDASADGFILAGGRSSRMGRDKALVNVAGKPLIQHALDILRCASLKPRIAGSTSDLSAFAPTLPDDPAQSGVAQTGLGPLAGICSALKSGSSQSAVFLPVDLPLMPESLIRYLLYRTEVTESAIAVVSVAGFIQTFPVAIHRGALPALQTSLCSIDRNCLRAFRAAADALCRPFAIQPVELLIQSGQVCDPRGLPPADWFLNVNSPRDLTRAESLLGQKHHQVS